MWHVLVMYPMNVPVVEGGTTDGCLYVASFLIWYRSVHRNISLYNFERNQFGNLQTTCVVWHVLVMFPMNLTVYSGRISVARNFPYYGTF